MWYILKQLFTSVSMKVMDIYLHFRELLNIYQFKGRVRGVFFFANWKYCSQRSMNRPSIFDTRFSKLLLQAGSCETIKKQKYTADFLDFDFLYFKCPQLVEGLINPWLGWLHTLIKLLIHNVSFCIFNIIVNSSLEYLSLVKTRFPERPCKMIRFCV